ncbi:MAG: lytic transglycosylase domain-containing protein [Proteobacteria bacterium]|nr:lytic transglycosylase domain-containing protein [Pseudomonadota bacterium]
MAPLMGLLCLVGLGVHPALALGGDELQAARAAYTAADIGDYAKAVTLAQRLNNPVLNKILRWLELRRASSGASFAEITGFLAQNPDWPSRRRLLLRAEELLPSDLADVAVVAWFKANPPINANGKLRLAESLARTGDARAAEEMVRQAWIGGDFTAPQERQLAQRYKGALRSEDHVARLDRLLWDGNTGAAKRLYPRVDDDHRALAEARIHLRANVGGVEWALRKVPARLVNDPGLLYDRLKWRRVRSNNEAARDILLHPPANLVRPELWWREREYQARMALREGDISLAYKLAAGHSQAGGIGQADSEFLAGFIALRFLNDTKPALGHFQRLYEDVNTPISRARGAFWAGRAADTLANKPLAAEWYGKAAEHVTTFYGQLAAGRLTDQPPPLPSDPKPSRAESQSFLKSELAQAVRILQELGQTDKLPTFAAALMTRSKTQVERVLTLALMRELGRPDLAVTLARRVARDGQVLIDDGYPVLELPDTPAGEPALVHAVVRQESGFDARAVSRANAHGLMQLLPSTAKAVAKGLNVRFDSASLLGDPHYNLRLGQAYLSSLLEDFDGSYLAAVAAYNAGPGRVRHWLRDNGDPRRGEIDVLDWVEQIPVAETRNYVQRVLEGLQVYRVRLHAAPQRLAAAQAIGRWCLFGCGGVIEASTLPARVGRAAVESTCDPASDATCQEAPAIEIGCTPGVDPSCQAPVVPVVPAVRSRADPELDGMLSQPIRPARALPSARAEQAGPDVRPGLGAIEMPVNHLRK